MTKHDVALVVLFLAVALAGTSTPAGQSVLPQPPSAARRPHTTEIHGYTLKDDYFWLREKSNPEVIKYLESENAYTEEVMKPTKGLQETLYNEMLGRIKQTDLSVPSRIGEYFYYSRTEEGKQYPYRCRRKGSMEGPEEILLDLNALAAGHKYLGPRGIRRQRRRLLAGLLDRYDRLSSVQPAREGSAHGHGARREHRARRLGRLGNRQPTLFYTTEDAVSKRSDKFWRHAVGAAGSDLLYEEKSELFDVAASRSLDKKVIFLASYAKTSTEVRYLPADTPAAAAKVILPREAGHEYDVDHYNGLFYITTNKGAKNFKVVTAPMNDPAEKNWQVFIEHNPAVKISGLTFFANHIVVSEREGGLTELRVIDPKTRQSHRIATDEPDYALSLGANPEFETTTLRFSYQSMVTPPSVYDYGLTTRERKLLKRQEVLGGYDPSRYEARRLWAVARDGTKVPISVVHKKGIALDGKAPLLLYAYGSYGASGAPTFSSNRLSLLDRGVIYAIAYIRGGGEMGEEWREQGRMMKKINTFTDFIDCAELSRQGPLHVDRSARHSGRQRRRPARRRGRSTCARICSRPWSRKCRLSTSSTRCSTPRCR